MQRHDGHPNLKMPQMNRPKPAMKIRDGLGIAATASNHWEDKPMVTVVDDDRSILKALSRLFRWEGYSVSTFESGHECLRSAAASASRCLVLDVEMREINGIELLSRLRNLGCQAPVVFMTGHDSSQIRASALQVGAVGLLIKPFMNGGLLETVGRAIASQRVSATPVPPPPVLAGKQARA